MSEQTTSDEKIPKYDPSILPDMLPVYYKRLFPHKPFYRWLSYGLSEGGIFANREFSYTLHDDIYVRYRCYDTQNELENDICTTCPHKIDIGAVMNTKPKNFRITSTAMQPVQRELVFDIDMDDYNEVRTCCTGSTVCLKCWKFMALAARLLDAALREDFGFEHILWVFSGRRGVHGWVCDYDARHLDSRGRSAVAEYLQISTNVTINGVIVARVQIGERMHHSVRRALKFVEPLFDEIVLEDQNLFGDAKGVAKLLLMIPEESARKDVEAYLNKTNEDGAHSRVIWASFVRYANSMRTGAISVWTRKLKNIVEEIQLGILYPRLDINVTKGMNHLLKSPFCIHPGTGKVCVPFNCNAAGKFDPTTVPNISQLLQEINAFDDKTKSLNNGPDDKSRIKDYKKTGMFKGVVVFEEFLRKLESCLKAKAIDMFERAHTICRVCLRVVSQMLVPKILCRPRMAGGFFYQKIFYGRNTLGGLPLPAGGNCYTKSLFHRLMCHPHNVIRNWALPNGSHAHTHSATEASHACTYLRQALLKCGRPMLFHLLLLFIK